MTFPLFGKHKNLQADMNLDSPCVIPIGHLLEKDGGNRIATKERK